MTMPPCQCTGGILVMVALACAASLVQWESLIVGPRSGVGVVAMVEAASNDHANGKSDDEHE